jgi:hypothetical protein
MKVLASLAEGRIRVFVCYKRVFDNPQNKKNINIKKKNIKVSLILYDMIINNLKKINLI